VHIHTEYARCTEVTKLENSKGVGNGGGGVILRNLKIRGDDFQLCFHVFMTRSLVNAISITDAEVNKK